MKLKLLDLSVYYEVQGTGDPVILLHGWGADSGSLRSISTLIKENTNSRVYSIDLPGFGFSETPNNSWSVDNYVELVLLFMKKMNILRASFIGHSFGGRIAIKLSAYFPDLVDQLILIDSAGILPMRTIIYYLKVYFSKFLRHISTLAPFIKKTGIYRYIYKSLGSDDFRKASSLRGTLVKVVNEDLEPVLPKIKSKTLLIWGELDKFTPTSDALRMKSLIPSSTLYIINNAGHFPFLDNFPEFSHVILEFWRD